MTEDELKAIEERSRDGWQIPASDAERLCAYVRKLYDRLNGFAATEHDIRVECGAAKGEDAASAVRRVIGDAHGRDATIATLRQLIEGTVTALSASKDPQMTIVSKLLTVALSVPS